MLCLPEIAFNVSTALALWVACAHSKTENVICYNSIVTSCYGIPLSLRWLSCEFVCKYLCHDYSVIGSSNLHWTSLVFNVFTLFWYANSQQNHRKSHWNPVSRKYVTWSNFCSDWDAMEFHHFTFSIFCLCSSVAEWTFVFVIRGDHRSRMRSLCVRENE